MNKKQEQLNRLDTAIDAMNMAGIDRELEALSGLESDLIQPEDTALFAARIQQLQKEKHTMKHSSKVFRVALVAAIVVAMGATVYAASALNLFHFESGDRYVTFRTNQQMDEQAAREMVEMNDGESDTATHEGNVQQLPTQTFTSADEAARAMDVELVIPATAKDMTLENATGQKMETESGYWQSTVWLSYTDEKGRMLGVTTTREVIPTGSDITTYTTNDMDDGSLGSYSSKSGEKFTTLTESDETGENTAHIAMTMRGEYECAIVFVGYEQSEREEILDSLDFSVYGK